MQLNNPLLLIIASVIVIVLLTVVILIRRKRRAPSSADEGEQIYIGNLPYRTSEQDLSEEFSHYGRINDVRIVKDRRTGRSKGYAFITFSNARDAKKSLSSHGMELSGRSLVVHIAKPR